MNQAPGDSPLHRVLGVFAKEPRPGVVKSRLAAAIGAEPAARLYEAFLCDLLPRLITVAGRHVLAYASVSDREYFRALCTDQYELELQVGQDLGARMAAFFHHQFARGASSVVLVGSDSPDLPLDQIDLAFVQLSKFDVVLGPTDDGGYYAIGMRYFVNEIFTGIPWSTSRVFVETEHRLRELGVSYAVLQPWYDVDLPQDLTRLAQQIKTARRAGRDLGLARVEAVLSERNG